MAELTPALAIAIHEIGVGYQGRDKALAKVVIVNEISEVVYESFVKCADRSVFGLNCFSDESIVSQIRHGKSVEVVAAEVRKLCENRILVGYNLPQILPYLNLDSHPHISRRDLTECSHLKQLLPNNGVDSYGTPVSLRKMFHDLLGTNVTSGENTVEDARNIARLYRLVAPQWDREVNRVHRVTGVASAFSRPQPSSSSWTREDDRRQQAQQQTQQQSRPGKSAWGSLGVLVAGAAAVTAGVLAAKAVGSKKNRN